MEAGGASKRLQSKVIPAGGSGNQSPERSKRKDKWTTERQDIPAEGEGPRRRRLQDPVALEDETTENPRPAKRGRRDTSDALDPPERNPNPEYVPRSGHFYEHDDRSNWRSRPKRRPFVDGGRADQPKPMRRNEDRARNDSRWGHDRFLQLEKGLPPRNRGRSLEKFNRDQNDRRIGGRRPGNNNRMNGRAGVHQNANNNERGRGDSHSSGSRKSFVAPGATKLPRPFSRGTKEQDEWKHDLFENGAQNPASKREEDSVARAEALLAS